MSRVPTKRAPNVSQQVLPHFRYHFEARPKPVNCTTLGVTTTILADSAHPLYTSIQRRLSAWDPKKLHWAIRCPTALSRKRTVRMWAIKRIREAWKEELKRNGFDALGTATAASALPPTSSIPPLTSTQLTGALCIITRDSSITAPIEEIRDGCAYLLRKLIKSQDHNASGVSQDHQKPRSQKMHKNRPQRKNDG